MGSKIGVLKVAAKRLGITLDEYLGKINSGLKRCTKCKAWKMTSEFFKDITRGDGLSSSCIVCQNRSTGKRMSKTLIRRKAEEGLSYCRRCHEWKNSQEVVRGLCRLHRNEYNRERYANDAMYRAERREHAHSRKRKIAPIPAEAQEILTEDFDGKCAYCGAPATTWDHIIPISRGGETKPWNIVPACLPCNSSKNNRDLFEWADEKGITINYLVLDRMMIEYLP